MVEVNIENIIFDLGGVLVDWNPEYLYSKIFDEDQKKMDWFLQNICTNEWNMEHDAGRSFKEGTEQLLNQYPQYETWIRAFFDRWEEMLKGEIDGTVLILNKLNALNEKKLYALTNWSAETYPIATARFSFLKIFKGIVVSGVENTRKPFPKIYEILLNRYQLEADKCLFIDDNKDNIDGAIQMGMAAIHFKNPNQLNKELVQLGLLK
jgi:2-haloacid dehalogenase